MKVLLLGATGLVGSKTLELLMSDPTTDRIHLLSRRPSGQSHQKITEYIGSLGNMAEHSDAFNVDAVLCCLGTTIKKAGSKDQFRKVDFEYPLQAAKLARDKGVGTFAVVTALGSNSKSKVFYNKVKGELEDELGKLGLKKLIIIRPSIIIGDRKESRPAEAVGILIAKILDPLFFGPLRKYAGSRVEEISRLMIGLVKDSNPGSTIEHVVRTDDGSSE